MREATVMFIVGFTKLYYYSYENYIRKCYHYILYCHYRILLLSVLQKINSIKLCNVTRFEQNCMSKYMQLS